MRSGQMVADRYRLEELIGSGGMGVVWRAFDTELDRDVAVKQARPGDGTRGAERLRREAKHAARVHHPNAVTLFDAVREGAEVWLIMEYLAARDLAAIIQHDGPVEPKRAARIGAQIADALVAMHANGIVHRDIKPGNVLVTEDGVAKLTDFGISRWSEETLTQTGPVVGTPAYMAPELSAGGRAASPASDVFSLGATLFAAVEGAPPFDAGQGPPRPAEVPTTRRAGPLGPVLGELLAPAPASRPTAEQARASLAAVAGDSATPADPPPAAPRRSLVRPRTAVAAVGAAVLLAAGWIIVSSSDTAEPARPVMGDPRSADPCALTDSSALSRFGKSTVDEDYGGFNRCDILVEVGANDEVDVRIQLENADISVRQPGFTIEREPASDDACHRTIRFAEPYQIAVTAKTSDPISANLCAMADTATDSVMAKLNAGVVPRRSAPVDAASLFHANACTLLDGNGLARLPGVDAIHPAAGFANWECRWHSTTGPTSLLLIFDRNDPLTAEDGQPTRLGGHDSVVSPDGYGDKTCLVQVVHRPYLVEDGRPALELLLVVVSGDQPPPELCAMATDLATSAATNLPAR